MHDIALRTKVSLIALAVALVIALCVPAGYGLVAYAREAELVAFKARLSAGRVAKYVYAHEKLWQYQKVRLAEVIELGVSASNVEQRVFDAAGNLVLVNGSAGGRFEVVRSAPFAVAGRTLGRVEVAATLDPVLQQTLIVALFSFGLSFAAYFTVRTLPLRVLDRALGALETANVTLQERSDRLAEAHRLGKFGDWSYLIGDKDVWWSPEIFELLRYDPATFRTTRDAVLSVYAGDGARLVLDAQAEVSRSRLAKTVDVKVKCGDGSLCEVAVTSKALSDAEGRVVGFFGTTQDITERKHAEAQLEKLAYYDPLTGLANRALFSRQMDEMLARCSRAGTTGAMLLLDLDRFKEVNDSLGHAAGDELLVKVAHLLGRAIDRDHFLARLGGDEFAIIVPGSSDTAAIEHLAGKVIDAVSGSILLERGEANIGTSVGIASIPRDGTNLSDVLRNADLALYRAKEDGRGRFAFFEPDLNDVVQYKIALARDLRRAVSENVGLAVHYQPQVGLSTGRVRGFEALIRWQHPTRGNIPPGEFIPIAESSRLICDLGFWILRQAAAQAKAWLDAGEPPREVAVNVSAAQIWHTDLVSEVKRVLQDTGLPPHLLCLELTESLLADHAEGRVRSVLNTLKGLGVTLALDDFGTDYSSLGYLTQLPFDKLKIDRVFVDGVAYSDRARELLRGIIALGRGLGMAVYGEGAEKVEEVEILREFGCDLVQGYVFARPTVAADALAFARGCEANARGDAPTGVSAEAMQALAARLRAAA